VLAFRRRFIAAAMLLALVVFGRKVGHFQKAYFALARPPEHFHLAPTSTFAFPSGHTANATIAYFGAALLLAGGARWWRRSVGAALTVAFLVGLSRVMLGVHWPADVVGGWAFGGFWTLTWLRLCDRYECSRAKSAKLSC
jgi:undecaprenyl-diphosphatase